MDRYYYLIPSLPLLKFPKKPYLTGEEFIAEAEKWLTVEDFAILSQVDINNFILDEKDAPIVRIYKDFEYSIRAELASFRKSKSKKWLSSCCSKKSHLSCKSLVSISKGL